MDRQRRSTTLSRRPWWGPARYPIKQKHEDQAMHDEYVFADLNGNCTRENQLRWCFRPGCPAFDNARCVPVPYFMWWQKTFTGKGSSKILTCEQIIWSPPRAVHRINASARDVPGVHILCSLYLVLGKSRKTLLRILGYSTLQQLNNKYTLNYFLTN